MKPKSAAPLFLSQPPCLVSIRHVTKRYERELCGRPSGGGSVRRKTAGELLTVRYLPSPLAPVGPSLLSREYALGSMVLDE